MIQKMGKWRRLHAVILIVAVMAVTINSNGLGAYAQKGSSLTGRDLLKLSLDYCDTMDASKYTEDSYAQFTDELEAAKKVYEDESKEDTEYRDARDSLEKVKANLGFLESDDQGNPTEFKELSVDDMVADMGAGINLGNTMDGHTGFTPNETLWQSVKTTKEYIKQVHDNGFNTVRIPVTWGTMINDEDYSIDEAWISRVQDIIDYCISQDMYCILNVHHDGAEQSGWLRIAADDIDFVYEKYEGVWRTIATRFKDYDEHLIFESMNEVIGDGSYPDAEKHDVAVIMNLNQIFTNVVRSTGSNNAKRWLLVPARYTNIQVTTNEDNEFELPNDTVENRIFVSVHHYDMALGLTSDMRVTECTEDTVLGLCTLFQKMVDKFTSQGIPVIVGEYGVLDKNNSEDRAYYCEALTRITQVGKMVACYWDNGAYDKSKEPADFDYTLLDRNTGETIDKTVTDAVIRGTLGSTTSKTCADVKTEVKKGETVTSITSISVGEEEVNLKTGDDYTVTVNVEPQENNDVVLYKTDDENVATVYNGQIHAKGAGTTTVTAFSLSGSAEAQIKVTVDPAEDENPVTEITVEQEKYELKKGEYVYLNPSVTGGNGAASISYRSTNEEVATVSSVGKVLAVGKGCAIITIASSTGLTKTVKVTCTGGESSSEINLGLDVYYNDNTAGYYGNEVGEVISVTGEGQYTLTFDCSKDLSDDAKNAGITSINNVTAIYIKDEDVNAGTITKSVLDTCNIVYDKVVVDGTELSITNTEAKSAIKASGIFDTNDPINSWDGSSVSGVTADGNHVITFDGMDSPQVIEVTFTLSDMSFAQEEVTEEITAESIEAKDGTSITLEKAGDFKELAVLITPTDVSGEVSFISSDESIAMVEAKQVTMDSEGIASVMVTGKKAGKATITAYAANGINVQFEVTVSGGEKDAEAVVSNNEETTKDNNTVVYVVIAVVAVLIVGGGIVIALRKKKVNK